MFMLSGSEFIENISLTSQNMKFLCQVSEANQSQTSYSVEQADIFQHQSYSHDMCIILKSNTDIWYIHSFRYLYFRGKNNMIQNIQQYSLL